MLDQVVYRRLVKHSAFAPAGLTKAFVHCERSKRVTSPTGHHTPVPCTIQVVLIVTVGRIELLVPKQTGWEAVKGASAPAWEHGWLQRIDQGAKAGASVDTGYTVCRMCVGRCKMPL